MNRPFAERESSPSREAEPVQLPGRLAADSERGFTPDPEAVARVRGRVLAEFHRRAAEAAKRRPNTLPRRGWTLPLRPALSMGLAGIFLLASFGLVGANSGPGDPFYQLRLAAEDLTLPLFGSPSRHLDRLQLRLDEARGQAGDAAAMSAALDAYRAELQRALEEADDSADWAAVLAALDAHDVVLDQLAQAVPDAATTGLREAQDQVGEAQQSLRSRSGASPAPSESPDRTARPVESHRPSNR